MMVKAGSILNIQPESAVMADEVGSKNCNLILSIPA
jgi:hypothetical protein